MIDAHFRVLLGFLVEAEHAKSRLDDAYDLAHGNVDCGFTDRTVGEALAWQEGFLRGQRKVKRKGDIFSAAGAYQFLFSTLNDLVTSGAISYGAKMNRANQDRLAIALCRRRGADDYLAGRIGLVKFGNALAAEWASLPMLSGPKFGKSRYDGDGMNSARKSVEEFRAVLHAFRAGTA